jgi:Mrp family chromosome partitioning ATPase
LHVVSSEPGAGRSEVAQLLVAVLEHRGLTAVLVNSAGELSAALSGDVDFVVVDTPLNSSVEHPI